MWNFLAVLIFVVVLALIAGYWLNRRKHEFANEREKGRHYRMAQLNYEANLEALKLSPSDPDIRQAALQSGRTLAERSRGLEGEAGVTIYDEVAVMNDINEAAAGSSGRPGNGAERGGIETRLSTLDDLRRRNLIGEDEFVTRRQKILDEL